MDEALAEMLMPFFLIGIGIVNWNCNWRKELHAVPFCVMFI